jgi:glycosyltransferase involved in cell wall biosynthesis
VSTPELHVSWLLYGDRTLASSRLQGYLVHDELRRHGVESELLLAPPFPIKDVPWPPELDELVAGSLAGRVVVFQKLGGPRSEAFRAALARARAATVYVQSDLEPENELPFACDLVVCSSRWLAGWYRERGVRHAVTIPDPAEAWRDAARIDGEPRRAGSIRVAWVGYRKSWESVAPLREVLHRPGLEQLELVTVSNHPEADVPWSLERAVQAVESCDVGAVPTRRDDTALAKSSNRVVSFMALGLPVVADRIDAYEELIVDGETGFLCDGPDDWERALLALRSPATRREVALRARERVDPEFRPETVAARWLDVLRPLARSGAPGRRDPRLAARIRMHAAAASTREALLRSLSLREVTAQARAALAAAARAQDARAAAAFVAEVGPSVARRTAAAVRRRI